MTRHAVIGTAGHVDHGKTALVTALTGTDCDRLEEEKRRGITIELGFARWTLGPDLTASIVDVPGHERFVQTMVAGATGFDLVLLAVAADDGVMPQTLEHLDICRLLGVEAGVIAATKADLVDDDLVALLAEEIRAACAGGPLASAPIVPCSARDGRGLQSLGAAVESALQSLRPAAAAGPPLLAVDRIFKKAGFGTVVTGTLSRGRIATGDLLDVVPAPAGTAPLRVRGLSVHDRAVEEACATTRLALNLRGDGEAALVRGALLTAPGWQRATTVIDVELTLLPGGAALRARSELVLHVGTTHVTVRARPLEPAALAPGERGVVRLASEVPFAAVTGQRFILRRPELEDHRTVGGGVILDPHPRRARRLAERTTPLSCAGPDLAARIEAAVAGEPGGAGIERLAERLRPEELEGLDATVRRLIAEQRLLSVAGASDSTGRLFARHHLEKAKGAFVESLRNYHREHPALFGASVAELAGRQPRHLRPLIDAARAELLRERAITGDDRLRLPKHDPRGLHARVAAAYAERGLLPETDQVMRSALGLDEKAFKDAVRDLRRDGRLHRLTEGLHFHAPALDEAIERVRQHFTTHATLSPVELKALLGLTRKHAMPILEWLDARGVTRREGDVRVPTPPRR